MESMQQCQSDSSFSTPGLYWRIQPNRRLFSLLQRVIHPRRHFLAHVRLRLDSTAPPSPVRHAVLAPTMSQHTFARIARVSSDRASGLRAPSGPPELSPSAVAAAWPRPTVPPFPAPTSRATLAIVEPAPGIAESLSASLAACEPAENRLKLCRSCGNTCRCKRECARHEQDSFRS